jgi:hypothetical protein
MSRGARHIDRRVEELKLIRTPLVEQCSKNVEDVEVPCSKSEKEHCTVYAFPATKWRLGDCPMADEHLRTAEESKVKGKTRVGQQKSKKKSRRLR